MLQLDTTIATTNPWTGEVVGSFTAAGPEDVAHAAAHANEAAARLRATSWTSRGDLLARTAALIRARHEELAGLMVAEVGKPVTEARAEVERTARIVDFYAQETRRAKGALIPSDEPGVAILTRRRAIGPVVLITPWNFPLAIPAWKLAPAIVCGNPVLWKPASAAMACAQALAACFADAGAGDALALLLGGGSMAETLLDQPIAAVSFTGSTAVGHGVRNRVGPRGVRVQLELGGKNVAVVLDDADVPAAAGAIVRAAYGFAGQKCTATSLVLAEPGVRPRLIEALAAETAAVPWGDPADPAVWGGPVIDTRQADWLRTTLDNVDGERIAVANAPDHERVIAPQLWRTTDRAGTLVRDELFGPVLAVLDAGERGELPAIANASEYGLAASVFGRDTDRLRRTCNQLDVGVLAVNRMSTGLEPQAPVGGWKASGSHDPEQGVEAISFYTKSQTMYWKSAGDDVEFP